LAPRKQEQQQFNALWTIWKKSELSDLLDAHVVEIESCRPKDDNMRGVLHHKQIFPFVNNDEIFNQSLSLSTKWLTT